MEKTDLHVQTVNAGWDKPDTTLTIVNCADVWRVKTDELIPHLLELKTLLATKEAEKINRYQQEKDRHQRIISRSVLRLILSRYTAADPKEISFKLDHNQKLILQTAVLNPLQFNVSHSGDWILIAISTHPIGIDLEKINTSFTYQNLLDFSFSSAEKADIQSAANPYNNFYRLWTRKEAMLKATGKGLTNDLSLVPSLDGLHHNPEHITGSIESWQITSFRVDENHLGSVAFMPVKTALRFFNFQL